MCRETRTESKTVHWDWDEITDIRSHIHLFSASSFKQIHILINTIHIAKDIQQLKIHVSSACLHQKQENWESVIKKIHPGTFQWNKLISFLIKQNSEGNRSNNWVKYIFLQVTECTKVVTMTWLIVLMGLELCKWTLYCIYHVSNHSSLISLSVYWLFFEHQLL